jgi:hypothetical protein
MPKTIQNYSNERTELLQKMFNILEISKEHNTISLKKLDEDTDLQQKILDLIPDIKKYFLCSRWTLFSNKNREIKREYLSLIKSVMKDMDINYESKRTSKKISENVREWEYIYIVNL